MSRIEQLEHDIEELSPDELKRLRAWFIEFDAKVWDRRIEADAKAGKLDRLISDAASDYKSGKSRSI